MFTSIALFGLLVASRAAPVEKWNKRDVESAIANAAAQDPSITEVGHWKIHALVPKRVGSDEPGRYLVPFRITYSDASNSYCRVAQWQIASKTAAIVSVPESANIDSCSGFGILTFEDVNGDRLPDLVGEVHVHSNRFDGEVSETVAYLSTKGVYCYSTSAAKGFGAEELSGPSRAGVIKRLREMSLSCD
jgi:hypothetical protein